jgi:chromosome transmission fidelity protein 18
MSEGDNEAAGAGQPPRPDEQQQEQEAVPGEEQVIEGGAGGDATEPPRPLDEEADEFPASIDLSRPAPSHRFAMQESAGAAEDGGYGAAAAAMAATDGAAADAADGSGPQYLDDEDAELLRLAETCPEGGTYGGGDDYLADEQPEAAGAPPPPSTAAATEQQQQQAPAAPPASTAAGGTELMMEYTLRDTQLLAMVDEPSQALDRPAAAASRGPLPAASGATTVQQQRQPQAQAERAPMGPPAPRPPVAAAAPAPSALTVEAVAATAAPSPGGAYGGHHDAEMDEWDLDEELEHMLATEPTAAGATTAAAPSAPAAAGGERTPGVSPRGARLPLMEEEEEALERLQRSELRLASRRAAEAAAAAQGRRSRSPGAGAFGYGEAAPPAAAAAAAAAAADKQQQRPRPVVIDMDAELEDLFGEAAAHHERERRGEDYMEEEEEEAEAAAAKAQAEAEAEAAAAAAALAAIKPATLRSLDAPACGADAAAARERLRARAADPARRPRRLAADVATTGGSEVLPVTCADGTRVYCRLAPASRLEDAGSDLGDDDDEDEEENDENQQQQMAAAAGTSAAAEAAARRARRRERRLGRVLLSAPISELLRRVEEAEMRDAVAEAERAAGEEAVRALQQQRAKEAEGELPSAAAVAAAAGRGKSRRATTTAANAAAAAAADQQLLWVDKHAPKGFPHLLSDERTNREVARWVKAWDQRVFGSGAAGSAAARSANAAANANTNNNDFSAEPLAPDGAPEARLLLIAGAPGTGKTTLAHVVARHCGYRPLEINASDDRSASALTRRIKDAAEMSAALDKERRPNLIVVDEVDGATGGAEGHSAVAALLKLVMGTGGGGGRNGRRGGGGGGGGAKGKGGGDGGGGDDSGSDDDGGDDEDGGAGARGAPKKSRRNNSNPPLGRPVVCLCNDLHAPALRPLREKARVVLFRPPPQERLVERLAAVCRSEGFPVERAALHLLAERTQCDIRACLNVLQLLASRRRRRGQGQQQQRQGGKKGAAAAQEQLRPLRASEVAALPLGQKDIAKSAMTVMQDLLLGTGAGAGGNGAGALPALPIPGAPAASSSSAAAAKTAAKTARHPPSEVARLYSVVMDFGDDDLLAAAVQENLHDLRQLDVDMRGCASASEALSLADCFGARARRGSGGGTDAGSLVAYVPACLIAAANAAGARKGRGPAGFVGGGFGAGLQWPRAGSVAARRAAAARAVLRSWVARAAPETVRGALAGGAGGAAGAYGSSSASAAAAAAGAPCHDLLTALRAMLRPAALRPVAPSLWTAPEAALARQLSLVMVSAGVTYALGGQALADGAALLSASAVAAATGGGGHGGHGGGGGGFGGGGGRYGNQHQQHGGGGGAASAADALALLPRAAPLCPPLDLLHRYDGLPTSEGGLGGGSAGRVAEVPVAVRQALARAAQEEAMRRAEANRFGGGAADPTAEGAAAGGGNFNAPAAAARVAAAVRGATGTGGGVMPPRAGSGGGGGGKRPADGGAGGDGADAGAPRAPRRLNWLDQLKRQKVQQQQQQQQHQQHRGAGAEAGASGDAGGAGIVKATSAASHVALYAYNEGYTNAVKRPLRVRELLG